MSAARYDSCSVAGFLELGLSIGLWCVSLLFFNCLVDLAIDSLYIMVNCCFLFLCPLLLFPAVSRRNREANRKLIFSLFVLWISSGFVEFGISSNQLSLLVSFIVLHTTYLR